MSKKHVVWYNKQGWGDFPTHERPYAIVQTKNGIALKGVNGRIRTFRTEEAAKKAMADLPTEVVIMKGGPEGGIGVFGPFDDKKAAENWLTRIGAIQVDRGHIPDADWCDGENEDLSYEILPFLAS